MADEVLGWLLPDARAEEQAVVRRVITALRLLRDDARLRAGRRAAPSWQRARKELEFLERRVQRRAIDALLHAYLSALRSADSFLDLGPRTLEYDVAWRTLLSWPEATQAGFPPAPTEPPCAVIERLLAAGETNGASPYWRQWWGACARHVAGPLAEAEQHWETLLRSALGSGTRAPFRARLVAGLAAARLELFQPARAWALHDRHAELVVADPSLRRLLGWSALLCGQESSARRLLQGTPAVALPASLAELREDWPAWGAYLTGSCATPAFLPESERRLDRKALGALLLGVFARHTDGRTEVLALDAPGELRAEVERRLQTVSAPGTLLAGALLRRARCAEGQAAPADSLGGSRTRALFLAAIRDPRGEFAGWIQLESTHQLLPSAATLSGLARAWRVALLAARGKAPCHARDGAGLAPCSDTYAADDPRAEFARQLFAGLGPLLGWRAYWIEPGPGAARVRAEHGGALGDWSERPGGGRIAWRAQTERTLSSHLGQPADSIHAEAASGFALPLLEARGARVLGVLVLESARTELAAEGLRAAARAALALLEPVWWATSFRAACRAHDGRDIAWELCGRFLQSLAPALEVAAGSRAPLLLVGPPGAGRRTLARWLHFRDPNCRNPSARGELIEGASPAEAGSRVFDLAVLGQEAQLELARTAEGRERLFLLAPAPVHFLRERGVLTRELEHVLEPEPLCVPPLRERRDEIPALVRVLADGVARAESLRPPCFDDEAVGDLWRQDWDGNVSALAALVAQLVRASPGRALGGPDVRAALRARGLEFRARLSSLRPSALDLELALATTRHRVGSENRTRAARYLGWDPDTLRARLCELLPGGRLAGPSE